MAIFASLMSPDLKAIVGTALSSEIWKACF